MCGYRITIDYRIAMAPGGDHGGYNREYQVEEKELKRMMEPIELWKKERSRRWKEKLSPEGKRRERKAEKRRRYWRNKKRRQMGLPQEPEEPRCF